MWLIFGIFSTIFALLNIGAKLKDKETKYFRFLSLSFTSLTLLSFYQDGANRIIKNDWAGLMDTMPTIAKTLWILTILSIALNSISLFDKK